MAPEGPDPAHPQGRAGVVMRAFYANYGASQTLLTIPYDLSVREYWNSLSLYQHKWCVRHIFIPRDIYNLYHLVPMFPAPGIYLSDAFPVPLHASWRLSPIPCRPRSDMVGRRVTLGSLNRYSQHAFQVWQIL